jgi:hypothetical protein
MIHLSGDRAERTRETDAGLRKKARVRRLLPMRKAWATEGAGS